MSLDCFAEHDFYEILELTSNASLEEIEVSFQRIIGFLTDPEKLAKIQHSEVDAAAVRELVKLAYHTLKDPNRRAAYDKQQQKPPVAPVAIPPWLHKGVPVSTPRRRLQAQMSVSPESDQVEFNGTMLRKLRESANASLEYMYEMTKISKRYLEALENDDFNLLPAPVYVRGFVCAYAEALGLDQQEIAGSYMATCRHQSAQKS